jgi:hypothetical protein
VIAFLGHSFLALVIWGKGLRGALRGGNGRDARLPAIVVGPSSGVSAARSLPGERAG